MLYPVEIVKFHTLEVGGFIKLYHTNKLFHNTKP